MNLLIPLLLGYGTTVSASDVVLSWNPNTEPDLAGYKIYYGTSPTTAYTGVEDVALTDTPDTPEYTMSSLADGTTYYFWITAYDLSGNESGFSNEGSKTITTTPSDPTSEINGGFGCGAIKNINRPKNPPPRSLDFFLLVAILLWMRFIKNTRPIQYLTNNWHSMLDFPVNFGIISQTLEAFTTKNKPYFAENPSIANTIRQLFSKHLPDCLLGPGPVWLRRGDLYRWRYKDSDAFLGAQYCAWPGRV